MSIPFRKEGGRVEIKTEELVAPKYLSMLVISTTLMWIEFTFLKKRENSKFLVWCLINCPQNHSSHVRRFSWMPRSHSASTLHTKNNYRFSQKYFMNHDWRFWIFYNSKNNLFSVVKEWTLFVTSWISLAGSKIPHYSELWKL